MKKSLIESGHIFGSSKPWPAPGKWPELQSCGMKAKCRDCKKILSLERFNHNSRPRKDGSLKKLSFCVYCQSKALAKNKLMKKHIEREQERRIA